MLCFAPCCTACSLYFHLHPKSHLDCSSKARSCGRVDSLGSTGSASRFQLWALLVKNFSRKVKSSVKSLIMAYLWSFYEPALFSTTSRTVHISSILLQDSSLEINAVSAMRSAKEKKPWTGSRVRGDACYEHVIKAHPLIERFLGANYGVTRFLSFLVLACLLGLLSSFTMSHSRGEEECFLEYTEMLPSEEKRKKKKTSLKTFLAAVFRGFFPRCRRQGAPTSYANLSFENDP
uniref:Transmembrane protein n=1 Tax=Steinernema glaseri TaxID=37863 RepID=A0A1I7Y0I0_9BILA